MITMQRQCHSIYLFDQVKNNVCNNKNVQDNKTRMSTNSSPIVYTAARTEA